MNNLSAAIRVETLKARRSRVPLLTQAGFLLLPLAGAFFMLILRDPAYAREAGFISTKAQLTGGSADWPGLLDMLGQGVATAGIVFFGFIAAWLFGREFVDHTAKDLLALPTARSTIVLAKFVVMLSWALLIMSAAVVLGLLLGLLLRLPLGSPAVFSQGLLRIAGAGLLTAVLTTPVALIASAGRGYLQPLAFVVLAIILAQIAVLAGWGDYFPWAVPALFVQGLQPAPLSYALVLLTGVAGVLLTAVWWELADQAG